MEIAFWETKEIVRWFLITPLTGQSLRQGTLTNKRMLQSAASREAYHAMEIPLNKAYDRSYESDPGSIFPPATYKDGACSASLADSGTTRRHIAQEKIRVLLVDDEETVRQVSMDVLQAMGYEVQAAKDGDEAITLYREKWAKIDIVLLDVAMPKMDGGEVYECLRKINPSVRVLLLTGYGAYGVTREILKRGCNGFIQKPFGMEQLSRSIREICDGR